MKILGVDPGYGRCGFAILDDEKLGRFGVISTEPGKNLADRLVELAGDFEEILKTENPDVVSIEDLFFVQNITTGIQVAEARGILIFLAKKAGCQIVEPKPVEIKKSFTGNGSANKSEMQKMARLNFGLDRNPKLDDATDAIAAAFFAVRTVRLLEN
ncbi:crossover junction endodeoxyribonuclease RuvC [bacterium]|jgi:crossover junction endodeoxyribonuclease RuvC|nr:crossover junction endodeoxyribonuclease RuvC [bacterium]MBT6832031.1 crossover junction endodeoxyribonuclease RuvC [bacterium]MBT6995812.1 crossover junction endodeoxyribonuclease RuvC [bacterium]MBT7772377.1 crossover junction endodeoxyribonuclease RuvC [bacterium]